MAPSVGAGPGTRPLLLAIAAVSATSAAATLASPVLLVEAPLLLAALSPRVPFLVVAAGGCPLPLFLLVGTLRLGLADPLHYLLGRRLDTTATPARRLLGRFPRLGAAHAHVASRLPAGLRLAARPACCVAVTLRPTGLNLLWAGSLRLPPAPVALLDVTGTVAYLTLLHAGAAAVGM